MIVCLCKGVSDREIEQLIDDGASSVSEVAQRTEAGTDCGSCACDIRNMIAQRRCANRASLSRTALLATVLAS